MAKVLLIVSSTALPSVQLNNAWIVFHEAHSQHGYKQKHVAPFRAHESNMLESFLANLRDLIKGVGSSPETPARREALTVHHHRKIDNGIDWQLVRPAELGGLA